MNPDSLLTLLRSEAAAFETKLARLLGSLEMTQLALLVQQRLPGVPTALCDISRAAWNLLDIRISDVLVKVWNEAGILKRYLNPREYNPDEAVLVELTEHRFRSDHHPRLEILVDGQREFEIVIDVRLELTVSGMVLKIRDAKIEELKAGWCTGKAEVSCGGLQLVERETGRLEFPGSLSFGAGIPIAP